MTDVQNLTNAIMSLTDVDYSRLRADRRNSSPEEKAIDELLWRLGKLRMVAQSVKQSVAA